jgi:hypothetical protein
VRWAKRVLLCKHWRPVTAALQWLTAYANTASRITAIRNNSNRVYHKLWQYLRSLRSFLSECCSIKLHATVEMHLCRKSCIVYLVVDTTTRSGPDRPEAIAVLHCALTQSDEPVFPVKAGTIIIKQTRNKGQGRNTERNERNRGRDEILASHDGHHGD